MKLIVVSIILWTSVSHAGQVFCKTSQYAGQGMAAAFNERTGVVEFYFGEYRGDKVAAAYNPKTGEVEQFFGAYGGENIACVFVR